MQLPDGFHPFVPSPIRVNITLITDFAAFHEFVFPFGHQFTKSLKLAIVEARRKSANDSASLVFSKVILSHSDIAQDFVMTDYGENTGLDFHAHHYIW